MFVTQTMEHTRGKRRPTHYLASRGAPEGGPNPVIAGEAPLPEGGRLPKGRLGREFTTEDGYRFARTAALDLVSVMRTELGSLDRVARVVEIQGFLNAVPEFEDHAKVLNGCSDLLVEIFGERGVHARSVLGARSLRGGLPVILKGVVEVQD